MITPEFIERLQEAVGGTLQLSAVEVPLASLVEAQQEGTLQDLEIHLDSNGAPFLLGRLVIDDQPVVAISESFAPLPVTLPEWFLDDSPDGD